MLKQYCVGRVIAVGAVGVGVGGAAVAQPYAIAAVMAPLGSAYVDHDEFTFPNWNDKWADYSGTTITTKFTYNTSSFSAGAGVGYSQMLINDGVVSVFKSVPTSLRDMNVPQATVVGTPQDSDSGYSVLSNGYDVSGNSAPLVGSWFSVVLNGSSSGSITYNGYPGVFGTSDTVVINLDPTEGTIKYVGPNQSKVIFQNYTTASAESNTIEYGVGANVNCTYCGISEEYFDGLYQSQSVESAGEPMSLSSLSIDRGPATCGDARDALISEYQQYGVFWAPVCTDFTQSAASQSYTFAEFNVSDNYGFALLRYPLIGPAAMSYGLDLLVGLIKAPLHPLTSGYRTPSHNAAIGGASNSRHMFGDAVDMVNFTQSKAEHDNIHDLAIDYAGAGYVEPLTGPCGYACVHVVWRNTSGLYAP